MMKGDVLALTELAILPEIAVVTFVGIFVIALYLVFRPGAKQYYEPHRSMALDDENPVRPMEVNHG